MDLDLDGEGSGVPGSVPKDSVVLASQLEGGTPVVQIGGAESDIPGGLQGLDWLKDNEVSGAPMCLFIAPASFGYGCVDRCGLERALVSAGDETASTAASA